MGVLARQRSDRSKNLVEFKVADVLYAIDIGRVREIINPLPIVQLPHAPASIRGVADHREEVVPIMDLRVRFGLEPASATRKTKWVIVSLEDRSAGFVVDSVTDVFGTLPSEQRHLPDNAQGMSMVRGITNVFAHDSALVFVLDVDYVATPAGDLDISQFTSRTLREGGP